jgi:hypothetical protein
VDVVVVPYSKLADLEQAGEVITLEQTTPVQGKASWRKGGEPCTLEYDTLDPGVLPPFPEPARNTVDVDVNFLTALDEAAHSACRDAARYAINHIQLRGKDGAVVATDGKQLLIQKGFGFPWKDEQFIPALPAFGCRELPRDEAVKLGLAKEHITLEVGPWMFAFKMESVRFPDADRVVPDARGAHTRLHLDAEDVDLLCKALPKLPGEDDPHKPVTLDLGGALAVRARGEKGPVEEVTLSRSKRDGPPLQAVMDRRCLHRALKLGFTEILITNPTTPLLCKDEKRIYVWMPLADAKPLAARQVSRAEPSPPKREAIAIQAEAPRRTPDMPPNEEHRNGTPAPSEALDPLSEAEELRAQLQAALARTSGLIASLKTKRRESRVVESALASLRRLQQP